MSGPTFRRIPPDPNRAKLIGKIVLARFLERPVPSVLAAVQAAEETVARFGLLDGRRPALRRRQLPGLRISSNGTAVETIGRVRLRAGRPVLFVHSVYLACAYVVDQQRFEDCLRRVPDSAIERVLRAVRTLLLASTRNRLTAAICAVILEEQRAYLRTLDDSRMVALTGRHIARACQRRGLAAADATRVSRILRSTLIVVGNLGVRPLRALCPTSRVVLRAQVRKVLEDERRLLALGRLRGAWSDDEIARRVAGRTGMRVSRRIVSYCRQVLGAPTARVRARRGYLASMVDFSPLATLDRGTLLRRAPETAGVYELRIARGEPGYCAECAGIIYIGKAKNLRRRLLAHASGNGRNRRLARHVRRSRVLFRFRPEAGELRLAEIDLYQQFCETYGRPPECNRMRP